MNKNSGKILAVVAILAMVVCALAVAMPATDAAETHKAADTDAFADALATANDGDIIELTGTEYGKVAVKAETNDDNIIYYDTTNEMTSFLVDKDITIKAAADAEPAIYGAFVITATGATIDGLAINITYMSNFERNAITIAASSATVTNCTVNMAEGSTDLCNGIMLYPTTGGTYTITGNTFNDFTKKPNWNSNAILVYENYTLAATNDNMGDRLPENFSYTSGEITDVAAQLRMVAGNEYNDCEWLYSVNDTKTTEVDDENNKLRELRVMGNYTGELDDGNVFTYKVENGITTYTLIFTNSEVKEFDLALLDKEVFVVSGTGDIFVGAEYNGTVSYGNNSVSVTGLKGAETDAPTFKTGSVTISGTISGDGDVIISVVEGEVKISGNTDGLQIVKTEDGTGNISIGELTINSGAKLIVADDVTVDITGKVTTEGTMFVAGTVTVSTGSISNAANVTVDKVSGGSVPSEIAEKAENNYNYLANVDNGITSNADKTWEYNTETNTLTLTNFTGTGFFNYNDLAEVKLVGTNTINVTADVVSETGYDNFAAIRNNGDLKISGDTLIINGTGALPETVKNVYGVFSKTAMTIDSAEIVINNGFTGKENDFGTIVAGILTKADLTLTGASVTADVECDSVSMTNSAVNGSIIGDIQSVTGNVDVPSLSGEVYVPSGSTVIVDTLDATKLDYEGAAIIVTKELKYNPTGDNTSNIIVTQGIPKQIMPNQIYLADGAKYSGKVTPVQAIDPISGYYVNNVNAANDIIDQGYDVSIISLEAVNIEGLVGAEDVIVTIGTVTGTNNNFVGTIATNSIENATINNVQIDQMAGSGMTVVGADGTVTINGTGITGEVKTTVTGDDGDVTSTLVMTNVSAGEAGITFSAGSSIVISGDIILNGGQVSSVISNTGEGITEFGTIVLGDATITGKGTIDIKTLVIRGDVEIGTDVVINVAEGSTFTVEKDGYLSGTGTVNVEDKATITVLGGIADTVTVKTPTDGVDIAAGQEDIFISALQYYDKINVTGNLNFTGDELAKTINVTGKTINVNTGVKITVDKGFTLNFVDSIVNAEGASIVINKGATIGVNGSDVYCPVQVEEGAIVNATNNVTDITGSSILLTMVGFGNIVNFSNNYTLASQSTFTVYGTINVAEGYTLTIAKDASMIMKSSADLTVAGNLVVNGTLEVAGTADVTGTLNVTGIVAALGDEPSITIDGTMNMTGTMYGEFANKGTVNVDGAVTYTKTVEGVTSTYDTTVKMYDGATLNIEAAEGTIKVTNGTAYGYPEKENANTKIEIMENGLTLTDVEGLVVAATEAVESETVDKETTVTYTMNFDLSGSVTAGTILVDVTNTPADKAYIAYGVGDVTVSQTLSIAADVTLTNNETITVSGDVDVAIDGTFDNTNGTVDVTGTVDVVREKARGYELGGKVNATYYQVTGTDSVTTTYTNLADAITAAATADKKTATAIGEQKIAEGATVTVPADIILVLEGTIDVKGTLVFNDFEASFDGVEDNIAAEVRMDADPARTYTTLANAIDMGATDIVLNDTVTLKDDLTIPAGVTVSSNEEDIIVGTTESKKNVTLTVKGAVEFTDGAAIILETSGNKDDKGNAYEGVLSLSGNGYVYAQNEDTTVADVTGAHYKKYVDHDADEDTPEVLVNVISTVTYAAADSSNVYVVGDTANISIVGKASAGDVSFAVHVDEDTEVADKLTITLADKAELTVSSMTIVPGVTVNGTAGTITGSVASTVGTVDLDKVTGITIVSEAAVEDEENPVPEMLTIDGDVTGDITVSAGTVTIVSDKDAMTTELEIADNTDEVSSSLTVASGATLEVLGDIKTGSGVDVAVAGTMNVSGTATIGTGAETDNATFSVTGKVTVTGTMTVDAEATVDGEIAVTGTEDDEVNVKLDIAEGTIAGTIDANQYTTVVLTTVTISGDVTLNGAVVLDTITVGDLGTEAYELGTAVAGNLTIVTPEGEKNAVTLTGYVKAYNGTTVAGLGNDVKSTAYNVNGAVYMTVYAPENTSKEIMGVVYDEKFNLTEGGLALDTGLYYAPVDPEKETSNSGLYNPANWYKSSNMLPNTILTGSEKVGEAGATTVYAEVEPVPVTVSITVTNGLTLYLDGQPVNSGSMDLAVGEHTVFIQPQAGYKADNATITFAGQTIVTGTGQATIVLTADMENAVIFANGAEQTSGDITIDIPENPDQPVINVNTGDGEMSLTDYLLIVLVVLIVIMAIIVALRLMRS